MGWADYAAWEKGQSGVVVRVDHAGWEEGAARARLPSWRQQVGGAPEEGTQPQRAVCS